MKQEGRTQCLCDQCIDVAVATGEFAQTVSDLASSDVGKQLSHSFSGLAEVQRTAQEIQSIQSEQDMVTIMGTGELRKFFRMVIIADIVAPS